MKTFTHVPLPASLPELQTQMANDKRFYLVPSGDYYPSLTSVLSILSEPHIAEWKARVGLEEAARISTHAAQRGTDLHAAIEDYLSNRPVRFPTAPRSRVKLMFQQLRPQLNHIDNIYAQEVPLYSDDLMVAGRCDCIAEYKGTLSIIDFKSATKAKKKEYIESYFLQASGYAAMFEERTGIAIDQIVILMAGETDYSAQVFVESRSQYIGRLQEVIGQYIDAQMTSQTI